MRKHRSLILRILISVVGLALVVQAVDLSEAADSLLSIHLGGFVAILLLFQAGIVIRAGRWWALLRSLNPEMPFLRLVWLYYVGMFFNLFLPTGFGGDVVRAAELSQNNIDSSEAAATVLLDRMIGLMGLFALALLAVPFSGTLVEPGLKWLTASVSLVGLLGGLLVLQGGILGRLIEVARRLTPRFPQFVSKLLNWFGKFNGSIRGVSQSRGAVWAAFGISVVFNLLLVLIHYLMSLLFGLDVPLLAYALIVPLTSILLLVPSIQGVGVRESAFVVLVGALTPETGTVLALSVAIYLLNLFTGMIGAGMYFVYSLRRRQTPIEQV